MPISFTDGQIDGGIIQIGMTALYTATPSSASINEGQSVTINVYTELAPETSLFYSIPTDDFLTDNGLISLTNGIGSFVLTANIDRTTEGSEDIPIYIRRGNIAGEIVAECLVRIQDTSLSPTYQVTFSSSPINEGASVTFNIATTSVLNGTILYWTKGGTTFGTDFSAPANPEFGQVTISGNAASVTFTVINDATTEGTETILFELRTGSNSGPVVAFSEVRIFDTSRAPGLTVTASPNPVNEGAAVTIQIPTSDGVPQGTTYFWDTNIVTDVTPTTGTFVIDVGQNPQAQFSINVIADKLTEGTESFFVNIRSSLNGAIVATTPNIFINDTSLDPTYAIVPNIGSPFRINEGQNVTFNISTANVDNGTILYWVNTGTAGAQDLIQNTNFGNVTVLSAAAAFTVNAKLDQTTEAPGSLNFVNSLTIASGILREITVSDDGQYVYGAWDQGWEQYSINTATGAITRIRSDFTSNAISIRPHPSHQCIHVGTNAAAINSYRFQILQRNTLTNVITRVADQEFTGLTNNSLNSVDFPCYTNDGSLLIALHLANNQSFISSSAVTTSTGALTQIGTSQVGVNLPTFNVFTIYSDMKIHPRPDLLNLGSARGVLYISGSIANAYYLTIYYINQNGTTSYYNHLTTGNTTQNIVIDKFGRYLYRSTTDGFIEKYRITKTGWLIKFGVDNVIGSGETSKATIDNKLPFIYFRTLNTRRIYQYQIDYSTGNITSVQSFNTFDAPNGYTIVSNPVTSQLYLGNFKDATFVPFSPSLVTIAAYVPTQYETLAMQVSTISTTGPVVATSQVIEIMDASQNPAYFVEVVPRSILSGLPVVWEGDTCSFRVITENLFDSTNLFWTINNQTTQNADFSAISGDFFINGNTGTFTVNTLADSTTEGNQNFYVEIRTGSASGPVVTTSTSIIILDTSIDPTYNVTRNPVKAAYDEGETIIFNITTTDVPNGTTLYWTALGTVNGNDFTGGVHFGSVFINANAGSVSMTILNDASTGETTETFQFAVRTASTTGAITTSTPTLSINDTSNSPVWVVTPGPITVDEGQTTTINISGSNIPNGTYYWTISHVTTNDADFNPPLFGSFNVSSNIGSYNIAIAADMTTEGNQTFNTVIKSNSTSGPVQATSPTITINDTSLTPSFYVTTSTTNVNEGSSVGIIVTTTNFPPVTLYYTISGSNITPSDFSPATLFGSVVLGGTYAAGRGSTTLTLANDLSTGEGAETFVYNLRTFNTSGPIVATGPAITINDTSFTPGYSINPVANNFNEGTNLTINVATTHVPNGTFLYWTISDGTTAAADFVSTNGNFAISAAGPILSGTGSFSVSATDDLTTEGDQTFQVQLRTGSTAGPVVATSITITINDTSLTRTYGITGSPSSVNEGASVTFSITTGQVPGGTTLYWTVTGTGLTTSDFASSSLSGSVLIAVATPPNGTGSFSVTLTNDLSGGEGTETFAIQLRTGSTSGPIVATSNNITVSDTSFTPTYAVVPSSSSVSEGGSVNFTVTTYHVANGTRLYYQAVHTSSSQNDFTPLPGGGDRGQFDISASGPTLASTTVFSLTPIADELTEGAETFRVDILSAAGPQGEQQYTTPGTYSWLCPAGVNSVCVVCVGGGGTGSIPGFTGNASGGGGGGGGLGWKNNINVTPGQSYTVVVGAGGAGFSSGSSGVNGNNGGNSYFINISTVAGYGGLGSTNIEGIGGTYVGDGGGLGGNGGKWFGTVETKGGGGGGAGGYAGNGGTGGSGANTFDTSTNPTNGNGGGGAGGATNFGTINGNGNACGGGGGGGGVGLLGQGASGLAGVNVDFGANAPGGGGGSQGGNGGGGTSIFSGANVSGAGGAYGGGSGGATGIGQGGSPTITVAAGGSGAVRIIWGSQRLYPSSLVPTGATVVASSSLVTINDTSFTPSWSSGRSSAAINEGDSTTFNITTGNVTPGTYYYTISGTGLTGTDFTSPSGQLNGSFTVSGTYSSGSAAIVITLSNDLSVNEGTETFVLQLRTRNQAGPIVHTTQSVTVTDSSFTPTFTMTYSTSINEGASLSINYQSYHYASQTLYAVINNVTSSGADFSASSVSFNITSTTVNGVPTASGSFNITPLADELTEGAETFTVSVKTGSATGPTIATTNNITINDTSKTVIYSLASSSYNYNEGSLITVTITAVNGTPGTTVYWEVSGTNVTGSDFNSGSVTGTAQILTQLPGSGPLTGDILLVAGGGAGGTSWSYPGVGGGGGGGGVVHRTSQTFPTGLYPITVGLGGQPATVSSPPTNPGYNATPGGNTVFLGLTALGGGAGSTWEQGGFPGGSGGGGVYYNGPGQGQATQPGSPSGGVGFPGGARGPGLGGVTIAGGGGGAGQAGYGYPLPPPSPVALQGRGGDGITLDISGVPVTYAGGGGGGSAGTAGGSPGGSGGGGGSGHSGYPPGHPLAGTDRPGVAKPGTDGLGGGGGGTYYGPSFGNPGYFSTFRGAAGGSGIIVWKVANNNSKTIIFSGGITYSSNTGVAGFTIYTISATASFQDVSIADATTFTGSFQLALSSDNSFNEGGESFVIYLRTGSSSGPIVATSPTFTINDTSAIPVGQSIWDTPGTYTWTIPAGVNQFSVVTVGAGGGGSGVFPQPPGFLGAQGGGGGATAWQNNILCTPGQTVTVRVGTRGSGGSRGFSGSSGTASNIQYGVVTYCDAAGGSGSTFTAAGISANYGGGGVGGIRGVRTTPTATSLVRGGGGGGGGYNGRGGTGYFQDGDFASYTGPPGFGGTPGEGGGGGGGFSGGGGGGVGLFGQGGSGAGGRSGSPAPTFNRNGAGGSGGEEGVGSSISGRGGNYGGGGNGTDINSSNGFGGRGANGAVRIIWGGTQRYFPNTNTGNF